MGGGEMVAGEGDIYNADRFIARQEKGLMEQLSPVDAIIFPDGEHVYKDNALWSIETDGKIFISLHERFRLRNEHNRQKETI